MSDERRTALRLAVARHDAAEEARLAARENSFPGMEGSSGFLPPQPRRGPPLRPQQQYVGATAGIPREGPPLPRQPLTPAQIRAAVQETSARRAAVRTRDRAGMMKEDFASQDRERMEEEQTQAKRRAQQAKEDKDAKAAEKAAARQAKVDKVKSMAGAGAAAIASPFKKMAKAVSGQEKPKLKSLDVGEINYRRMYYQHRGYPPMEALAAVMDDAGEVDDATARRFADIGGTLSMHERQHSETSSDEYDPYYPSRGMQRTQDLYED